MILGLAEAEADCTTDHCRRELFGTVAEKVVTEMKPDGNFWDAEPEHQGYLERYPHGYTCHYASPLEAVSKSRVSTEFQGVIDVRNRKSF